MKKIVAGLLILGLLLVPLITNMLVTTNPPFGLEVNVNNDWIGFFSSFFGAIIGGLVTYLGVKLTINDQVKSREDQLKIDNRPQLQISEVCDATYDLGNVPPHEKSCGRLIITSNYKVAEEQNLTDGYFNFICINSLGPGIAVNCNITTGIKFEDNNQMKIQDVFIPTININDRVFIPVDPIPSTRQYRILQAKVEFETVMGEKLKVERDYRLVHNTYVVSDFYYIMDKKETYNQMYEVRGSNAEWKYI